jgi:hypothetical protein
MTCGFGEKAYEAALRLGKAIWLGHLPDHRRPASASSREAQTMTEKTVDLDGRRGMEAQKATDLRRLLAEVEANERSLRLRQEELEAHLADAPAASWEEAADKVRYILGLYAATLTAEDTRRRTLVEAVLKDLERLASAPPHS